MTEEQKQQALRNLCDARNALLFQGWVDQEIAQADTEIEAMQQGKASAERLEYWLSWGKEIVGSYPGQKRKAT
jgi:hypothetical protein